MAKKTRTRRTAEQKIADLEAKIAAIRTREAQRADPALRHVKNALKGIEQALAATKDAETKHALLATRSALSALSGAPVESGRVRRSASDLGNLSEALLAFVRSNPGKRGEEIAAAMGTDTKTMRPVMKRLIADGKVATKGQKRGMTYAAV